MGFHRIHGLLGQFHARWVRGRHQFNDRILPFEGSWFERSG